MEKTPKEYFVKVDVADETALNSLIQSGILAEENSKTYDTSLDIKIWKCGYEAALSSMPEQEWVSDEEIETWVKEHGYGGHCTQEWHEGLTDGAKWMRDKLLNK